LVSYYPDTSFPNVILNNSLSSLHL